MTEAQRPDQLGELELAKKNTNYWMKKCEILHTQIEMLTAPETTKWAIRAYAELDADQKKKIDDLMDALLAIKKSGKESI